MHVSTELSRHAGHADLLREEADGAVGMRAGNDNLAQGFDYAAFTTRLRGIAEQFPEESR